MALEPAPTTGIFELDGREIGRPLLAGVDPAQSQQQKIQVDRPLAVPPTGSVTWEAEDGLVFAGMVVGGDEKASGKHFVWQPIDSQVTRSLGFTVWPLQVARTGRYYLWARTLAVDPTADSFALAVADDSREILTKKAWHLRAIRIGSGSRSNWIEPPAAAPLELPAGRLLPLPLSPRAGRENRSAHAHGGPPGSAKGVTHGGMQTATLRRHPKLPRRRSSRGRIVR